MELQSVRPTNATVSTEFLLSKRTATVTGLLHTPVQHREKALRGTSAAPLSFTDIELLAPGEQIAGLTSEKISPFVRGAAGNSGQPLDATTRSRFGIRLHTDFRDVRIHAYDMAARTADAIRAQAYTVGNDIVFGTNQYRPNTLPGQYLLAHELAHVAQPKEIATRFLSRSDDASEFEADRAADSVLRDHPIELRATPAAVVQRKPVAGMENAPSTSAPGQIPSNASPLAPSFQFAGLELTTYGQLAAAFKIGVAQVTSELNDTTNTAKLHERARLWIEKATMRANLYIPKGDTALSATDVAIAVEMFKDLSELRADVQSAKDSAVQHEMLRLSTLAKRSADEAEEFLPKIANAARAAFKSENENLLREIADDLGTMLDIGMGIRELANTAAEAASSVSGVELAPVSKYVHGLETLDKGLAVINLAVSLTGDKATTELDEGLRQVGVAAGAFNALVTLADGLPAQIGLYANLYLVPLTKICIKTVARLSEYMHEENKSWVEAFGEPRSWDVEPGGPLMGSFMVKMMKAESEEEAPAIPADVANFFLRHRELFNAGVGASSPKSHRELSNANGRASSSKIPITGIFFHELDLAKARTWIYSNRDAVWSMLYGSMDVPR